MLDCLIIGHNDGDFRTTEKLLRSMGGQSGSFRDLNLNYFIHQGTPYRAMDIINHFYPDKEADDPGIYNGDYLSLAVAHLGNYLHKHGFRFDFVNKFHLEKEKLKAKLEDNDISLVAITTTLYVWSVPLQEVIQFVRSVKPDVKIVAGGPYILNLLSRHREENLEAVLNGIDADFFVYHPEGEQTLVSLLQAIKQRSGYRGIKNLLYREGARLIFNETESQPGLLKENIVDWSIFPEEEIGEMISLRTAKSCPYQCAFCGFPQRAGRYTFLSPREVESSLDLVKKQDRIRQINFIDDTFNIPVKRFREILHLMLKKDYGFKWNSYLRCQFIDDETAYLMKESGCEGVYLGIESGNQQILTNMNKNVAVDDYRRGMAILKKHNITIHASFIIGFPGENLETIKDTIQFIEETGPDFFRTQLWYYDPLTPVYKQKEYYNISGYGFEWSHNTLSSSEALRYIDSIFMNMKNSLWLPQQSFDYLSLYYLRRKGYSPERIKRFIKAFNIIIRAKLKLKENFSLTDDQFCQLNKILHAS